ncbi:Ger(x)C family spore germination protein [Paenibacillus oryzisoli]|uniref:Ger(x)C family spore germination protein n=1 Tax=Paenibacillus oryzisoli TaxID=1850517 RepID=UPI003D278D02
MKKKCQVVCLLLIASLVLTGCWDRRELNELAIVVGIGLDKSGDNIRVTAQIVNAGEVASSKGGAGYSTPVSILTATESTISEALRKLSTVAPRRIYTSHLRVLVIGEELAHQGVENVMDGLSRNREFRTDFQLIIAKGTSAENVLEILMPTEKIPANKIYKTLELSEKVWAPTVNMPLDKILADLSNPTKEPVITGIQIVGDQETGKTKRNMSRSKAYANLMVPGVALFKQDKLVDWLTDEESKGYNYIMGNVKNSVGHMACPQGGKIAVEVVRTKSNIKGEVVRGKPKITVSLYSEENVGEVQCKIDLTKPETILQLEQLAVEKLTNILEATIQKAKKNKADIFGFGEAIEDVNPGAWKVFRKDWDQYFADLEVSVHVDVQIRRLGTTNNSLLERKE